MGHVEEGEYYLHIQDFARARKSFGYARRENGNDWRAWYGLVRVMTKNFTVYTGENWARFLDTAKSLGGPEIAVWIDVQAGDYPQRFEIMKNMRRPQ